MGPEQLGEEAGEASEKNQISLDLVFVQEEQQNNEQVNFSFDQSYQVVELSFAEGESSG